MDNIQRNNQNKSMAKGLFYPLTEFMWRCICNFSYITLSIVYMTAKNIKALK